MWNESAELTLIFFMFEFKRSYEYVKGYLCLHNILKFQIYYKKVSRAI